MNTKRFIAGALSAAVLIPSSLGLALLTPVIAYAAPHRAESASEISVSDSEISIHTDQISREATKSIELETGDSWEYDKRVMLIIFCSGGQQIHKGWRATPARSSA